MRNDGAADYGTIRSIEDSVHRENVPPTWTQIRICESSATTITVEAQMFIHPGSLIYRDDDKLLDTGPSLHPRIRRRGFSQSTLRRCNHFFHRQPPFAASFETFSNADNAHPGPDQTVYTSVHCLSKRLALLKLARTDHGKLKHGKTERRRAVPGFEIMAELSSYAKCPSF